VRLVFCVHSSARSPLDRAAPNADVEEIKISSSTRPALNAMFRHSYHISHEIEREARMPRLYEVKKNRLPLPRGPLGEGHPERTLTISAKPDVYPSETAALQRARDLVQEGYGISILLPDGREWSHEEVVRLLNDSVS
jgi:hypothetical protein